MAAAIGAPLPAGSTLEPAIPSPIYVVEISWCGIHAANHRQALVCGACSTADRYCWHRGTAGTKWRCLE